MLRINDDVELSVVILLLSSFLSWLLLWLLHPSQSMPGAGLACGRTAPLIGPIDNGIGRREKAERLEHRDTLHGGACLRGVRSSHMPQQLTRYASGRTLWVGAYLHECQRRPPICGARSSSSTQGPSPRSCWNKCERTSPCFHFLSPPPPHLFTSRRQLEIACLFGLLPHPRRCPRSLLPSITR